MFSGCFDDQVFDVLDAFGGQIRDSTVQVEPKLLGDCFIVCWESIFVTPLTQKRDNDGAIFSGEHRPSHLNVAHRWKWGRARGVWLSQGSTQ